METKFGNGHQRTDGYIQITSGPNQGKLLHRLIYEENFGPIPEGFHIHHLDNDKNNNALENLVLISKSNHHKLHFNMINNPNWGNGRIDAAGGVSFLSASKNKGMTMQNIADELGYSNVSSVFHYIDRRGLRWNEL